MKHCRFGLVLAAAVVWPMPLSSAEKVSIQVADGHLDFRIGTALVSRYHIAPDVAKPYFWPVNAPNEVPLTRAWPMEKAPPGGSTDHPHQKSAWFCHGDVIPEGLAIQHRIKGIEGVDFWSEAPGHGRIVCTQVGQLKESAGNHAQIATHNEWRTADDLKVLDEERTIHLYDLGAARLIVLDIDVSASVCPVTFGDTKEGSMGIRINDQIRADKGAGRIENAEGKVGEKECWGYPSAWCDYSGPIDGKVVGLAILADPSNRYPSCWHSRGYGLMAANPFGRARSGFPAMKGRTDLVRLGKGEHLKLRYGLLLHTGDARDGKVAELYQHFVKLGPK